MNFFEHLARGSKLILSDKSLWPYMLGPVIVSAIIWVIALILIIAGFFGGIFASFFTPVLPILVSFLLAVGLFILMTLFFNSLVNLFLCLVNLRLSKKVLSIYGVQVPHQELSFLPVLKIEILKFLVSTPILGLAALITFFMPYIGVFVAPILTGFVFTFQYIDYSHEALLRTFSERLTFAKENFINYTLIGLFLSPALSIPFLNFFAIPWAITVTSSLTAERVKSQHALR